MLLTERVEDNNKPRVGDFVVACNWLDVTIRTHVKGQPLLSTRKWWLLFGGRVQLASVWGLRKINYFVAKVDIFCCRTSWDKRMDRLLLL